MPEIKYFRKVDAAHEAEQGLKPGPLDAFDFASPGTKSAIVRRLTRFALRRVLPVVAAVLRLLWPNPRFGRVILVTRHADCVEVFGDTVSFPVVYKPEMRDIAGGEDNILSLDGAEHDKLRAILSAALPPEDIANVAIWSTQYCEALLTAGGGRIDVMRDLITRSSVEVSCRLMGLTAHDPDAFAEWTMAQSSLLFGDFLGDPNIRKQAMIASAHLRSLIDDSIARARHQRSAKKSRIKRENLIDRLVGEGSMTNAQIRATVLALITAFTPTNTLTAGNMLEILLDRPAMYDAARSAALAGDRDALYAVLLEAGRLNPALSPGIWRQVAADATRKAIAAGTRRARMLRPGDLVLLCVPSALRDGRVSEELRDNPAQRAWLMFGSGPHDCLGARLAMAHVTSVFETLLRRPYLAPAPDRHGRTMMRVGPYPTRFDMIWAAPEARQANVLAAIPVTSSATLDEVQAELAKIGNPVRPALSERLRKTGSILFTSLTVIEAAPDSPRSILLLELNADGAPDDAIRTLAAAAFADYAPILRHCTGDGSTPANPERLAQLLIDHRFDLHRWPWGTTGLHFDGLPELSVRDVERQRQIAEFAREEVRTYLKHDLSDGTRAMDVLLRTRRMIKQDSYYRLKPEWHARLKQGAKFQYDLVRPSRRRLQIAGWTAPTNLWSPLGPLLRDAEGRPILVVAGLLWIAVASATLVWLAPASGDGALAWIWPVIAALVGGAAMTVLLIAITAGFLLWRLRRREMKDVSDDRIADLDHVRAVSAREDAPGHEQNHIIAVMQMKTGLLRRLTFAFSMWWIRQAVTYWFRPGFVLTMGTIHKARWFRVPRTSQFVFFSNYDGSWESYLEDFITRAHVGQTSAWTHGVGFPPTRYLVLDGAAHGDRFKRWVRRQQRVSPVWFSRFPTLTAKQIRRNAVILDGLARAANDTDARRWLACFGSAQREPGEIETQEAQSVLFTGFGGQARSTSLFVTLSSDPHQLANWLAILSGATFDASVKAQVNFLSDQPPGENGAVYAAPAKRIRFGDTRVERGGATLGLTAAGLAKAGLCEGVGLDQFPAAFRMGMAGRERILGDPPAAGWRFADLEKDLPRSIDAVLTIYGHSADAENQEAAHRALVDDHLRFLADCGGAVVHAVPCVPEPDNAPGSLEIEHFGFRDGLSQPFIRGSRRANPAIPERDIVAPGEFLLGYANAQGFVAPPIGIGAEHDPSNSLPVASAAVGNLYPQFGNACTAPELRDFGRNGAFLVVRQLDQDVTGFTDHIVAKAAEVKGVYTHAAEVIGHEIDADWLKAKIIGRWPDGSPLVGNQTCPAGLAADARPDNDFAYGIDDPQGLACPLGSHIRRANPRDSQEPGDPDEQRITNRHRLLRRGRSYRYDPGDGRGERKGLLFMALCSEIERQFEFVQHGWISATSFHGLTNEADPLLGNPAATKATPVFTIPTAVGPIEVSGLQSYVELRGGGYFFLPSRSALRFLVSRLKAS